MKITTEFLKDQIQSEVYDLIEGTTMTICRIHLKNGFIALGQSACLIPEDFDAQAGKQIAYANAYSKLWELYGFVVRQKAYEAEEKGKF